MARTNKDDWSASGLICSSGGSCVLIRGSRSLILPMMSSVEAFRSSGWSSAWSAAHPRARYWFAEEIRRARKRHRGYRSSCRPDGLDRKIDSGPLIVCGLPFRSTSYSYGPDLRSSGGQDQILRADGVDHVHRRKAFGLQRIGIQIHLHLPLFAAVWIGNGRAGHVTERVRMKFKP